MRPLPLRISSDLPFLELHVAEICSILAEYEDLLSVWKSFTSPEMNQSECIAFECSEACDQDEQAVKSIIHSLFSHHRYPHSPKCHCQYHCLVAEALAGMQKCDPYKSHSMHIKHRQSSHCLLVFINWSTENKLFDCLGSYVVNILSESAILITLERVSKLSIWETGVNTIKVLGNS